MHFADIFKKSFLQGWASTEIGPLAAITTMAITAVLALYIFLVYRVVTRKTFYSRTFNIAIAGVSVITAAVILTVQSSVVISLGMVGALSIVRFRTAVKDPMDLMFLFWSISIGIICGAGLAEIAVILSLTLTAGIFILERIPVAKAPMILVINSSDFEAGATLAIEDKVMSVVKNFAKHSNIKSRNMTASSLDLTIELRTDKGGELLKEIMKLKGITSASLLAHDGEVTF